jgi:hypothetical protein
MRDGGFTSAAYPIIADSRDSRRRFAELSSLIRGYLLTDSRCLAEPVLSQPGVRADQLDETRAAAVACGGAVRVGER